MEASNQFQLEIAIEGYLQNLQTKGNYTPDDILELKSHLLDEVDDLKKIKLDEEEAFIVAKKRLGKEEELNNEYKKVNGSVFYNRDLFVMVLSICTYLLFSYLYTISQNGLQYFAIYWAKNVFVWGIVNYVLQFAVVGGFIYLVFNSKKFLSRTGKLFSKSPANFSSLFIILVVALYFIDLYFQRKVGSYLSSDFIRNRYYQFTINNDVSNFVKMTLGSTVLIVFLAAFVTSYKKVKFLDSIINNAGYIALFCLGFFWDGLAASARMLNGIFLNNMLISSIGFGFIWFVGMFIFNSYLKEKVLKRNLVFISFGLVMEFAAGIWINPGLRNSLPVSPYFIALVIGGGLGYLAAGVFRKHKFVEITNKA